MAARRAWRGAVLVLGLAALALPLFVARPASSRGTGAIAGQVTIDESGLIGTSARRDRSGVVVYLEKVAGMRQAQPTAIRQRDITFRPRVAAVQVGTSVEFPNEDRIFHNVFS